MSGGVGPTAGGSDIRLPKEEDDHLLLPLAHSPSRRFVSFRQLNALALVVVLAASGMVSFADLAFVVFSFLYLYFLSSAAFPPHASAAGAAPPPPVFGERSRMLSIYVAAGALVGLLLPVGYILDGFLAGDKEGIMAATPHVFLLAAQVFMEGVTFSRHFSLPMRAFVPIFYNTKRIFSIVDWVGNEIGKAEGEHGGRRRLLAGRALAVANLGFWGFNLFGFLLPAYLPKALKKHYYGQDSAPDSSNISEEAKKVK